MLRMDFSFRDAFAILLNRWPILIAYALAGGLVFVLVGMVLPRYYQARANAIVDHNVEQVLPGLGRQEVADYLSHEGLRLETIAYSDKVWAEVRSRLVLAGWNDLPDQDTQLIQFVILPHPMDGEWGFVARHRDPEFAANLANTWAEVFVGTVNQAVAEAQHRRAVMLIADELAGRITQQRERYEFLVAALAELTSLENELAQALPAEEENAAINAQLCQLAGRFEISDDAIPCLLGGGTIAEQRSCTEVLKAVLSTEQSLSEATLGALESAKQGYIEQVSLIAQSGLGVSPYLEVALMQEAQPPQQPISHLGWYGLLGASIGSIVWAVREWSGLYHCTRPYKELASKDG